MSLELSIPLLAGRSHRGPLEPSTNLRAPWCLQRTKFPSQYKIHTETHTMQEQEPQIPCMEQDRNAINERWSLYSLIWDFFGILRHLQI